MGGDDSQKLCPGEECIPLRGTANIRLNAESTVAQSWAWDAKRFVILLLRIWLMPISTSCSTISLSLPKSCCKKMEHFFLLALLSRRMVRCVT